MESKIAQTWEQMNQAPSEPKAIPGLTEGRMVHYVLPDGIRKGEHRPAVIVKVWDYGHGTSNLQVFTDGRNDGDNDLNGVEWKTSIMYSEEPKPGTWHFIERA